MPFVIEHDLVSETLELVKHENGNELYFTVAASGSFAVLRPGKLQRNLAASVRHSNRVDAPQGTVHEQPGGIDDPGSGTHPGDDTRLGGSSHKPDVDDEFFDVDLRLYDPNGKVFDRDEVTLTDLAAFRTLRGEARPWSFTLGGTSRTYRLNPSMHETVTDPKGSLDLRLTETVECTSGPPLIDRTELGADVHRFTFDLYRVGDFLAEVTPTTAGSTEVWAGSLRLLDPDGTEIARSGTGQLRCPIRPAMLARSRDATHTARLWTLEVLPQAGTASAGTHAVDATVIGQLSVNTETAHTRLDMLLGPNGENIELVVKDAGDKIQAWLTVHDIAAAETIDMHGLLDSVLPKEKWKPIPIEVDKRLPVGTADNSFTTDRIPVLETTFTIAVKVGTLKTTSISASLGPSQFDAAGAPVLRVEVGVEGSIDVFETGVVDLRIATVKVRNNRLAVEVGLAVEPDGTPKFVAAEQNPFDFEFSDTALAALLAATLLLTPPGSVLAVAELQQFIENQLNDAFHSQVQKLFDDPTTAPENLMMLVGTHVTYLPPRLEGTDVLIEYVAPVEPEPTPKPNYAGAVGRSVLEEAVGHVRFLGQLGDTWAAPNLAKIDHIVIVMMENRSYDHVLGYRASPTASRPADGADGWTPELIAAVSERAEAWRPPAGTPGDNGNPVQPMRLSAFEKNGQGRRTQLPRNAGHSVAAVAQQLAGQTEVPGGKKINDPGGFIDNFRQKYLRNQPHTEDGVDHFDILRYYETDKDTIDPNTGQPVDDLPVYGFLADHYSYSDTFFCSHPGPTLPNRMYSLTGDVQHDRCGFAILDNNHGDNFVLSRTPTIFDILEREGVSWRVYESPPSVAMLRMFARYAGDNVNIRPVDEFADDVARGDLPSVVMVEPAMHHHPQNDDHPDADMWRGQDFIRKVYVPLAANRALFEKTLLVITYDEHGGLYDHVIPPIADVFEGADPVIGTSGGGNLVGPAVSDGGGNTGPAPTEHPAPAGTRRIPRSRLNPRDLGPGEGGAVVPEVSDGTAPTPDPHPEAYAMVPYGVRVPTFVISPWTPAGKGPSVVLDFCSILKTVLARFCADTKPFLSDRVEVSHSLDPFLSEPAPRPDPGDPPEIGPLDLEARSGIAPSTETITPPLFRHDMADGPVDSHAITGRLARLLGR